MDQSTMFYTDLRAVDSIPGGPQDTSMTGMLDEGILDDYDGLPILTNDSHAQKSATSLNSLISNDNNEQSDDVRIAERSLVNDALNGAGAGPLPTDFGQSAQGVGSTLTDFTKRRNWSQRVVEELEDLLHILTTNGQLLYLSPSCERLTGYTQVELSGKFIVDYIHSDDSMIFQREFNESISSGHPLRFFYRFLRKDGTYTIFESHGHPHLTSGASQTGLNTSNNFCQGFFMMARHYPTKNASLLDSFLEHKIENERLTRRINDLKKEEAEELEESRRNQAEKQEGRSDVHSGETDTMGSTSVSTPVQSRGNSNLMSMPPPAKPTGSNAALTRQNLEDATASNEPDSMRDKMARYEGATHIETIEMLTGLRYQEGERSQGISTGDTEPALIKDDVGIAIPVDKETKAGEKKKKVKIPDEYVCTDCGTLDSPEWRKGPNGPKTLCNACGLRWAKKEKKSKSGPGHSQ